MEWIIETNGFKVYRKTNATVVELPKAEYGSLANSSLERLQGMLLELADDGGPGYLVVDLSNVAFFAARFIGVLVCTWDRLEKKGQRLVLSGLRPSCAELVSVLNLEKIFDVHPTAQAALENIEQSPTPGLLLETAGLIGSLT
ncbi:MAG: STAS domain-containing protein [Planctomycetes bacterium]|nr:STAS domain-containing protein [Planctomycetota bacterium]